MSFPNSVGQPVQYPVEYLKHPYFNPPNYLDPYDNLGPIGYTKNTYQFSGKDKKDNNLYKNQHMKKTCYYEEKRRQVIAEMYGISSNIDLGNIAGTMDAYRVNGYSLRNKYVSKRDRRLKEPEKK